MLMMRLQRVGRKNNPTYRIVVTDKRTGPKSDKHVDRLGSYDPKAGKVQLDVEKAKKWLSQGVQPSGTMFNFLIDQKVITGKKINVLSRKSPIVDEEAVKRAADEAAAKAEAAKAALEVEVVADVESPATETPENGKQAAAEEAAEAQALADAEGD